MSEVDLWSDEVLADPFSTYAVLRDLGSAVWLDKHEILALPRYAQVHDALTDWRSFSSAEGVGVDADSNQVIPKGLITSDPPAHTEYRRPLAAQLSTRRLAPDLERIASTADSIVADALGRGTFDAVKDLARPYSLTVVCDLLGIPEGERQQLPTLAEDTFNFFGPANALHATAGPALGELSAHAAAMSKTREVSTTPRGAELCSGDNAAAQIINYTLPGVDTTANAMAAAIYLFASHPDQWDLVRTNPELIGSAFSEVLRRHSPLQYFTRLAKGPVVIDGLALPAGTRVLIMYGSANRDERHYADPDRFDVTRRPTDHLAFGWGVHHCVGHHLAALEVHSLLQALLERVTRFELVGRPEWMLNNVLHGPRTLPVTTIAT